MSTGFKIQLGVGSTPVNVADITELGFPKFTRDVVEASSFDSPDGYKEFVKQGLIDAGELSLTLKWRDATSGAALKTAFDSGDVEDFIITTTHETPITLDFKGIVKSWEPETPAADQMTISTTIKLTGKPTWG